MIFNRNFLQFFCVATTIVLCCDNISVANMSESGSVSTATAIQQAIETARLSISANKTKEKLCPAGYYIAQCGNYRVGFNWLKNATFPTVDTAENPEEGGTTTTITDITTKNYYIYDDTIDLFRQMRAFFGHEVADVFYTTEYGDDVNTAQIASQEDIKNDRELILSNVCHPAIFAHKCEKCPNNASVPASYVFLDNENNSAIAGSWNFYTIADCYMDEFEDSTGTYFYVPGENINLSTVTSGAKCYYSNTNPGATDALNGDEIGKFKPGLNPSHTILNFDNTIPSSNTHKIY